LLPGMGEVAAILPRLLRFATFTKTEVPDAATPGSTVREFDGPLTKEREVLAEVVPVRLRLPPEVSVTVPVEEETEPVVRLDVVLISTELPEPEAFPVIVFRKALTGP